MNRNQYELYHYGVKGMRWGHRKKQLPTSSTRKNFDSTKAEYKSAKKAYSKSFNNAYNKSIAAYSPSKKQRQRNDERWEKAWDDAGKLDDAKIAYKKAKHERKKAISESYRDIHKNSSLGEKLMYNNATRKKAAKYVVDNDMSVAEATKKAKGDAWRNTAAFMAAYGAVTLGTMAYERYR